MMVTALMVVLRVGVVPTLLLVLVDALLMLELVVLILAEVGLRHRAQELVVSVRDARVAGVVVAQGHAHALGEQVVRDSWGVVLPLLLQTAQLLDGSCRDERGVVLEPGGRLVNRGVRVVPAVAVLVGGRVLGVVVVTVSAQGERKRLLQVVHAAMLL